MKKSEIQLTITTEEAQTILDALGNLPFRQVFGLIGKIQDQASAQLQPNKSNNPGGNPQKEKS